MIEPEWKFDDSQSITIQGRKYNVHAAIFAARDLPVTEVPIEQVYMAFCSPAEDTFRSFLAHAKMVNDADLSYPLLYNENGALIDGKHRLGKAMLTGEKIIRMKRFLVDPPSIYTTE